MTLPTLIESPIHRPRRCPECRAESTDIRLDRCLRCRTPSAELAVAELVDAARRDAWRPWSPIVDETPPPVPADPNVCSTCLRAVHGLAEGLCLTCRLDRSGRPGRAA